MASPRIARKPKLNREFCHMANNGKFLAFCPGLPCLRAERFTVPVSPGQM